MLFVRPLDKQTFPLSKDFPYRIWVDRDMNIIYANKPLLLFSGLQLIQIRNSSVFTTFFSATSSKLLNTLFARFNSEPTPDFFPYFLEEFDNSDNPSEVIWNSCKTYIDNNLFGNIFFGIRASDLPHEIMKSPPSLYADIINEHIENENNFNSPNNTDNLANVISSNNNQKHQLEEVESKNNFSKEFTKKHKHEEFNSNLMIEEKIQKQLAELKEKNQKFDEMIAFYSSILKTDDFSAQKESSLAEVLLQMNKLKEENERSLSQYKKTITDNDDLVKDSKKISPQKNIADQAIQPQEQVTQQPSPEIPHQKESSSNIPDQFSQFQSLPFQSQPYTFSETLSVADFSHSPKVVLMPFSSSTSTFICIVSMGRKWRVEKNLKLNDVIQGVLDFIVYSEDLEKKYASCSICSSYFEPIISISSYELTMGLPFFPKFDSLLDLESFEFNICFCHCLDSFKHFGVNFIISLEIQGQRYSSVPFRILNNQLILQK